jgi:hypothetical protein
MVRPHFQVVERSEGFDGPGLQEPSRWSRRREALSRELVAAARSCQLKVVRRFFSLSSGSDFPHF